MSFHDANFVVTGGIRLLNTCGVTNYIVVGIIMTAVGFQGHLVAFDVSNELFFYTSDICKE